MAFCESHRFAALMAGAVGTLLLASCRTIDPVTAEALVRADAAKRSASYCGRREHGCEITVHRSSEGGWTALIVPIDYSSSGERSVGIDTDDFYIYYENGSFKSALRNYR